MTNRKYPPITEIEQRSEQSVHELMEELNLTDELIEFFYTQYFYQNCCFLITENKDINLLDPNLPNIVTIDDDTINLQKAIDRFNKRNSSKLRVSDFTIPNLKEAKDLCNFNNGVTEIITHYSIDILSEIKIIHKG
jgi:hypothetical protein